MITTEENIDQSSRERILRQVEFYFSDSNLPRDTFLQNEIKKNEEGYVDLSVLCAFTRMKQFLKISPQVKPESVKESTIKLVASILRSSTFLTVDDGNHLVKRTEALSKDLSEVKQEVDERSIYVVPFPYDATLDDLTRFFEQSVKIKAIMMRKHVGGPFRGSIFVECDNQEEQNKLLDLKLTYKGAPLRMEKKVDFVKRKIDERHQRVNSPNNVQNVDGQQTKQIIQMENLEDEIEQLNGAPDQQNQVQTNGAEKKIQNHNIKLEQNNNSHQQQNQQQKGQKTSWEDIQIDENYTPGLVIKFEFSDQVPNDLSFATVKEAFGGPENGVSYVNYEKDSKEGYIQYNDAEQVNSFIEKQKALLISDFEANLHVLQGEEDETYFKESIERKKKSIFQKVQNQQKKGNFKRKHQGGFNKNKRFRR